MFFESRHDAPPWMLPLERKRSTWPNQKHRWKRFRSQRHISPSTSVPSIVPLCVGIVNRSPDKKSVVAHSLDDALKLPMIANAFFGPVSPWLSAADQHESGVVGVGCLSSGSHVKPTLQLRTWNTMHLKKARLSSAYPARRKGNAAGIMCLGTWLALHGPTLNVLLKN